MSQIKWKSYEEVASYLLDQMASAFGLERVEEKQKVAGLRSQTTYEIDAKGINDKGKGFVIIECRRYTKSKLKQEQVGGLAYRIYDTGATGGIIVSPLGLQEGAKRIADAENILEIHLDENSTTTNFILGFLNYIFLGKTEDVRVGERVKVVINDAANGDRKRKIE